MSLTVQAGSVTAPASNGGTSTITLINPAKALILLCGGQTADGIAQGNAREGVGFATKDGGAIQQVYEANNDADAAATAVLSQGIDTDHCLQRLSRLPGGTATQRTGSTCSGSHRMFSLSSSGTRTAAS
jgi:hypothetical protein